MNATPLYIFDLDGTLCDITHRRHYVEKPLCQACKFKAWPTGRPLVCQNCARHQFDWKPNWPQFHAECVNDTPKPEVITLLKHLIYGAQADVYIWSGRSDVVRKETECWLERHVWGNGYAAELRMRAAGDYTPDDVLKRSWYTALSEVDQARLVCLFDDRDRVIAMYRSLGLTVLQVAPGDF